MEESFRARVEKAFGSLPIPSSSSAPLWSLSGDQFKPKPKSQPSSSGVNVDLENDLDEDENENADQSEPSDCNDEHWEEIKSSIGQDSTLDSEEEEDHYDKQAIGKDDMGDFLYMRYIYDAGIGISSRAFGDPRANHMPARITLKQDNEADKETDTLNVSEKYAPDIGGCGGDAVNRKSILKRKDNLLEYRSNKRVQFGSECEDRDGKGDEKEVTRDVRIKTSSWEEDVALNQPSKSQEFASPVPDYIRNPSRYTHYRFDSSTDMDDKVNKVADMSFLAQIKGSNSQADEALDDLHAVTFIPKKKSSDVSMGENETVSKLKLDVDRECMNKKAFPVSIAAAMEEAEEEFIEDTKKSSQRPNPKFRKKTELERPTVK